jgi:DNA mismatch endonuclease (patch repair protein)
MSPTHRDPVVTSRIMSRVRSTDTGPEIILRRELFRRGLRYRLYDRELPGKPDIVFAAARLVVFVDGDFWHGGGLEARGIRDVGEQFPNNRDFWVRKIARNVERDREVAAQLTSMGWKVLRVLESSVRRDVCREASRIETVARGGSAPAPL